ncbi:hypothetical protein ACPCKW_26965, partial [Streptomyces griseoincarnatus]
TFWKISHSPFGTKRSTMSMLRTTSDGQSRHRLSRQTERGAPRLDTPPTAAYLHAIGGELTITVTAGNSRFVSGACRSPTSDRPLDTGNGGS